MKCRNYKSYDPNVMNEDFKQVNWLPIMTAPSVNIAVNIFNTIVKKIFDKHAPPIEKRHSKFYFFEKVCFERFFSRIKRKKY